MPAATPSHGNDSQELKSTAGSFSRIDMGTSGPLPPLSFEGPRGMGLTTSVLMAASAVTQQPSAQPIPQPAPLLSLSAPETAAPAPVSTSAQPEHPIPTESTPIHPSTATPSLTPSSSLTFPGEPVSTPSASTATLTNNLALALPKSFASTPSLSLSSSPPSSSLSLHPISFSNLSTSYSTPSSSASSLSAVSTPNTSPSNSPIEPASISLISSPLKSDFTPYPASPIKPAQLAALIERGKQTPQGVSAGPRPLILDLRSNPDFDPVSIVHSININLPTLLMRRYRKGGAVSAFALESFITMPSDKDVFHVIQDGWRQDLAQDGTEVTHDVIVLDQDMKAGKEEYGRSPSPAWTLASVLERGGGNLGGQIRLWYLEGGFEAFQAWDLNEKYLLLAGSTFEMSVTQEGSPQGQQQQQDVEMTESQDGSVHPPSMPASSPSNSASSTYLDPQTAQAISNAVSMTNASLGTQPRQRGAPARRESLFSLNTKSLQRPAGLSRSQTVGMGSLNVKPLSIPPPVPSLQPLQEGTSQPLPPLKHKGSWLTVPAGAAPTTPSLSPAMSLNNNSLMDISQSASPDRSSTWSASSGGPGSGSGEGLSGIHGPMLSSKKSFSSTITVFSLNQSGVPKGIQEEDEGEEQSYSASGNSNPSLGLRRHHSEATYGHFDAHGDNSGAGGLHHQEFQGRSFADGIDSYANSFKSGSLKSHQLGYDDEMGEEGGDDGEQEISCILPNFLFLGPEIATEEQVQELERLGVKRVLNMARECEDLLVVNRPGMEYHKVGVLDHIEADVSAGLLQAVDIIGMHCATFC